MSGRDIAGTNVIVEPEVAEPQYAAKTNGKNSDMLNVVKSIKVPIGSNKGSSNNGSNKDDKSNLDEGQLS